MNEAIGKPAKVEPMNYYLMGILQNGGIKPMIKKMQDEKKKRHIELKNEAVARIVRQPFSIHNSFFR